MDKKIIIICVSVVLILILGITVVDEVQKNRQAVDEQYGQVRSKIESTTYHIGEYLKDESELQYSYTVSNLHTAFSYALCIEEDEAVYDLGLELIRTYGHLTKNFEVVKEHLARLNVILGGYVTDGSAENTVTELREFNDSLDAVLEQKNSP